MFSADVIAHLSPIRPLIVIGWQDEKLKIDVPVALAGAELSLTSCGSCGDVTPSVSKLLRMRSAHRMRSPNHVG